MEIDFTKTKKAKKAKANKEESAIVRLDAQVAQASFDVYEKEIRLMQDKAQAIKIKDDPTLKEATEFGVNVARLLKRINEKKKEITDEPNQYVRAISNFCKNFAEPLRKIEDDIKKKITQYQVNRELERKKTEELARKERERLQKEIDEKAKKEGVEPPIVPVLVMPKPETVTRSDEGGGSHQRKVWTFEIVDAEKLPRKYLMPNEKAIRDAIKMGVREIEGVRIFEQEKTILRTV